MVWQTPPLICAAMERKRRIGITPSNRLVRATPLVRVKAKCTGYVSGCCRRRLRHTAFLTVILAFAPTDGAALTSATVCNVLVADILRRYSMQVRSVRWSRPQSIAHIEELVHPLPPGWSAEVNGCGRPYFIKCVRAYVCACVLACVYIPCARACVLTYSFPARACVCVRACVDNLRLRAP